MGQLEDFRASLKRKDSAVSSEGDPGKEYRKGETGEDEKKDARSF